MCDELCYAIGSAVSNTFGTKTKRTKATKRVTIKTKIKLKKDILKVSGGILNPL